MERLGAVMKVRVRYADGHYWLVGYTEGHAAKGMAYVTISDAMWAEYDALMTEYSKMQQRLQRLDNELYDLDHVDED
jgi:hypothetical protein